MDKNPCGRQQRQIEKLALNPPVNKTHLICVQSILPHTPSIFPLRLDVVWIYPDRHPVQFLCDSYLTCHPRGPLLVIRGCQQHVQFLILRLRQVVVVRLDIDSTGGTGQLLITESEDIGILVDCTIGHVH